MNGFDLLDGSHDNNSGDVVINTRKRTRREFGDPLKYYQEHYSGLTRGQLQRTDPALYNVLRNRSLLVHIARKVEPDSNIECKPVEEQLNHLREFFESGFMDRNHQLEPVSARTDDRGSVCFLSFSLNGSSYTARIYLGKPNSDIQLRPVRFHNRYGWLLGIYENDSLDAIGKKLLGMCKIDRTKKDCLRHITPNELYRVGQKVIDSRYGRGEVVGTTDTKAIVYFKHPIIGFKEKGRLIRDGAPLTSYQPLDLSFQVLSIV